MELPDSFDLSDLSKLSTSITGTGLEDTDNIKADESRRSTAVHGSFKGPPSNNNVTSESPASSDDNNEKFYNDSKYAGDKIDDIVPVREDGYQCFAFPDPGTFVCFYNKQIRSGEVTLHPWQAEELEKIGNAKATALHPYKFCLVTCNGSGKDAFIIASTIVWFACCKIRSRSIITSSSGIQLTSQTEGYIRSLCQIVNEYHQCEIFRIRQRYITCRLSGSEIRLFATDEAGKAEGYHPMDPNAEMLICVNEGKSVHEDIHGALRRCTGYNYWLEISTPGEPNGFFYNAFKNWPNVRVVSTFDCPHLNKEEVEEDKRDLGEHSALYRSKHLALFTSIDGGNVISKEIVDKFVEMFKKNPFDHETYLEHFEDKLGIDLAAGGDENSLRHTQGSKLLHAFDFREVDTEIAAIRINSLLKDWGISKSHKHIYADDGGIGKAIIDKLVHMGWTINRINNQSAAINKTQFGNKGAENWYRCKRIIEEGFFDVSMLDSRLLEQLTSRRYKGSLSGGRLFLEAKKDAKAEGRPSPDRADALILSMTGNTVEDFFKIKSTGSIIKKPIVQKEEKFTDQQAILQYYEDNITFARFNPDAIKKQSVGKRAFNSLKSLLN